MTATTRTARPYQSLIFSLIAILSLAFFVFMAQPAQAHDQLIDADPAPDAQLSEAPSQITLTYSGNLIQVGNIVEVLNAESDNIATAELQVNGPNLVQDLPTDAPEGWYLINWRAVSSDGHPITGNQYYLVGDNADLPKPPINPEFVDDHHHDAADEVTEDEAGANTPLIIGSLVVAGIGIGIAVYFIFMRKKPEVE